MKFKTTKITKLNRKGPPKKAYGLFLDMAIHYRDSEDCPALKELLKYLGICQYTLRKYGKSANIGVSILSDKEGVFWVHFYTKED